MTVVPSRSNADSVRWRSRTPAAGHSHVLPSSPSKASPLIRRVFRSPYPSSPSISSHDTKDPSSAGLNISSAAAYRLERTPPTRSAPLSPPRPPASAGRMRHAATSRTGHVSPAQDPRSSTTISSSAQPAAELPVILRSAEEDKFYIASARFKQICPALTISLHKQLKLRLHYPTSTVNLFHFLVHEPRSGWSIFLSATPLESLISIYHLADRLQAIDALAHSVRQAIADRAADWPWEVLQFASETEDVELARCAIQGLAGGDGDRLARGAWDAEEFKGISQTWLVELLRLEQKYTAYPLASPYRTTPRNPGDSPRSPAQSALSAPKALQGSPLRFSSPAWRLSHSPLLPSSSISSPMRSVKSMAMTPPRLGGRRAVVDWEAVASEFDPKVAAQ